MIAKIEQLLKEVEALHASNAEELEALRIKYLSKKGAINDLMADFRNVPAEPRRWRALPTPSCSVCHAFRADSLIFLTIPTPCCSVRRTSLLNSFHFCQPLYTNSPAAKISSSIL